MDVDRWCKRKARADIHRLQQVMGNYNYKNKSIKCSHMYK